MPTINMIATGKNIKNMMTARGMKTKDIQTAFGFNTPQAIFKWFRGDSITTVDNLVVLAKLFDTTMDNIIVTN